MPARSSLSVQTRLLAGAGGIVLLVGMFLDWYSLDVVRGTTLVAGHQGRDAWQAFEWIDYVMVIAAVAGLASAVFGRAVPILTAPAFLVAAGAVTAVLILYRIVERPYEASTPFAKVTTGLQIGVFVGLAGAVIIGAAGARALRRGS